MALEAEIGEPRQDRRWMIASAAGVAGLMGLSILVMDAADERDHVVLTRNEVVAGAAGDRVWRGAFTNVADRPYRDVAVRIRFLDRLGAPVGEVSGRVAGLAPGRRLDLEAPLPPAAVALQVHALRWRAPDAGVVLGPYNAWPFGYLQQ